MRLTDMTEAHWKKAIEKLHECGEVRLPDRCLLVLLKYGDVALYDTEDGHCIICAQTVDRIKRIFMRKPMRCQQ